jgi:hypothetical protein
LGIFLLELAKQLTRRHGIQCGTEVGADGFVQGGVFGEVVPGGELGELEVEDGLGAHGYRCLADAINHW